MKAVILAAGMGVRLQSVTNGLPKALAVLKGKTLLQWNLERLRGVGIAEAGIVVGAQKKAIVDSVGSRVGNMPVTYIDQPQPDGNGSALLCAEAYVGGEGFLMLSCDVIPSENTLRKLAGEGPREHTSIMVAEEITENISAFGVLETEHGYLKRIEEKPADVPERALVNRSTYYFTPDIFGALKKIKPNPRTQEYWLTDAVQLLAREDRVKVMVVDTITDITNAAELKSAGNRAEI